VEVGGGLREYSAAGRAVLDGYAVGEMSSSGRGQVLVPWPNRIQDGSYEFDGRQHQLPIDDVPERGAIHGLVRWASWRVGERETDRVVMEHVLHPRPGYPFSLELEIEYRLSADGLRVRASATNLGASPCPYGAGQHPYLTLGAPTVDRLVLQAPARTVLRSDERGIPIDRSSVEATDCDFRQPRPVGPTRLDHAFTDLERDDDGLARVKLRDAEGADDLPAERFPLRRGADQAGTRPLAHGRLGHRALAVIPALAAGLVARTPNRRESVMELGGSV
jgi:galactose mutarotase-like enzyme